jgi:hypothetical protein
VADDWDILAPSEAYEAVGVSDTSAGHDSQLTRMVTAVSRRIDELCGAVVQRTVTDEPYDGGRRSIELPWATAAVTSVKEYTGTTLANLTVETITAPTSTNYVFDKRKGFLYRRSGGMDYMFAPGRANVLVTRTWGRYPTTMDVDEQFKTAAEMVLHDWWQASAQWWEKNSSFGGDMGFPPLPPRAWSRAVEALGDQRRPPTSA